MSSRNIRKLYGGNSLPPPDSASDEEYEPLYAKVTAPKFHGLDVSSHSDAEHESTAMENTTPDQHIKQKKKKKKKMRKLPNKQKMPNKSISKHNLEELDEIDKSVLEVNAILGTPPAPEPAVSAEVPAVDPMDCLLAVQAKYLNPAYELKKMFGPEENEQSSARRRGRQPYLHRRKAVIVPVTESHNFLKSGLSMSIHRRENGCIYFAFDHSREYQRNHRAFLQLEKYRGDDLAMAIEDARKNMHIEGMLECIDSLFRGEAYSTANTLLEEIIAYMQYVAHPSFNLNDRKVRLEYRITENRPFHIAVLKYLYLLTNRACHRTALELAKMLLNLDPSDPLAILFIIDTVALRAREHQWLIDAIDFFAKERDAGFLFNIQYSYAMAHFHVATKNKWEISKADELLRTAMLQFPGVLLKLLECASASPSARVKACALFSSVDKTTGKKLRDLEALYAKLTWSKWRESRVFEWLNRNADQLAEDYDKDTDIQERSKEMAFERLNMFQGWPEEVVRHLSVIKPMSMVLVEGAVPRVNRSRAADPVPPADGLSRYGYGLVRPAVSAAAAAARSPLIELFSSVLPNYAMALPPNVQQHIIEAHIDDVVAQELVDAPNEMVGAYAAAQLVDLAAELEALSDDDHDTDEEDEEDEDAEDEAEFVMSVGALTGAIRRFMHVYETGRDPADNPDSDNTNNSHNADTADNPDSENTNNADTADNADSENTNNADTADNPDADADARHNQRPRD